MIKAVGDMIQPRTESQWHLDKRVPIALIFAMFVQVVMAVWFLSTLHAEVRHLIKTVEQQAVDLRQQARLSGNIIRMESDIVHIREMLTIIKSDSHRHAGSSLPANPTE